MAAEVTPADTARHLERRAANQRARARARAERLRAEIAFVARSSPLRPA